MNVNSSTSSTTTSYNRITGLATGLDTDSIVKASLQGQQSKIDKADQQKQLYQFQQDLYRDAIKQFKEFYSKYTDITNTDTCMLLSKNYQSTAFTTGDTTGSVSAEGLSGAVEGTYNIKVANTATRAAGSFADLSNLKSSATQFTVNGKTVNIDLTTSLAGGENPTDDELMAKINSSLTSAGIDAKMTKSTLSGYRIQTNQTGSAQSIGISVPQADPDPALTFSFSGTDAHVTVTDSYGTTAEKTYSSNSFTIDNVRFTISNSTPEAGVTFTGKTDVSALQKRISDFVKDYNKLIESITTKLQEKKYSDYPPLTDAQREEMTEDQIEKWEAKTKSGLLRNDSYLNAITSQMRSAINTAVGTSTLKYTDIGIDFTNDYSKPGQLTLDETKLKAALEGNPDQVISLFTSTSDAADAAEKYGDTGIMQRLKTILNDSVNVSSSLLLKKAGYTGSSTLSSNTLQTMIDKQAKLISSLKEKYADQQTALYNKYAALETAMNGYNNQLASLSSMLGY
ncbi:MAG: fliD [Firmicutes bacterium]|nr:fliD [Bacillota bacterium]